MWVFRSSVGDYQCNLCGVTMPSLAASLSHEETKGHVLKEVLQARYAVANCERKLADAKAELNRWLELAGES